MNGYRRSINQLLNLIFAILSEFGYNELY